MFRNIIEKFTKKKALSQQAIAELINTTPEALEKFEKAYRVARVTRDRTANTVLPDTVQPSSQLTESQQESIDNMTENIVNDLLVQTKIWSTDGTKVVDLIPTKIPECMTDSVNPATIEALPADYRPQLTGLSMSVDLQQPSSPAVLYFLQQYLKTGDRHCYDMFRQGLDILDLDPLLYDIIGTNKNSMGYWLPAINSAVKNTPNPFFKIPATKVVTVPITLLQLTRQPYELLTPTTKRILNEFCRKAFDLDDSKTYFVKTGTNASKFNFRNAKVQGASEVQTLGEYLLYNHSRALSMASPLCQPSIYGMATTTEWVVRDFIEDKENNPTIYNGLPLHTEYRVFVDMDRDRVLSIENYWRPDVMEQRFERPALTGLEEVDNVHDAITYGANKARLCERYEANKDTVAEHIAALLPNIDLCGQWSIDVMQNGDDFYIIDMATAESSAFYESVEPALRRPLPENWIPKLPYSRWWVWYDWI